MPDDRLAGPEREELHVGFRPLAEVLPGQLQGIANPSRDLRPYAETPLCRVAALQVPSGGLPGPKAGGGVDDPEGSVRSLRAFSTASRNSRKRPRGWRWPSAIHR